MKKITHLLYSGLGGHGSVFFSLVKADTGKEFETKAIFCGIEDVRNDYIDQCKKYDIAYGAIRKKRGLDLKSYFSIYNLFRKMKPDVIFLHGAAFIIPASWYRLRHKKVKIIVRDTQAHHLKNKMEWRWFRLAYRAADRIVFLTPESMKGVVNHIKGINIEAKGVVIHNGLDTDLYRPVSSQRRRDQVTIGMQSRLQKIKDHPTLLSAFASVLDKFPEKKIKLRIAGDGETMNALRDLVMKKGIEKEVEFCGMLDEHELLDFMQSLDIYVHATFGETMSNSIMQAMACGLPIIASDVWGVNNMIKKDVNGLLYPSGDSEKLCEMMCLLISDEKLRNSLSFNARAHAENEYSLKRFITEYKKLF